eukprot:1415147-Rhodomonas_salina.1
MRAARMLDNLLCTRVQGTRVPGYPFTLVPWYRYQRARVPWYPGTRVPWYPCTGGIVYAGALVQEPLIPGFPVTGYPGSL